MTSFPTPTEGDPAQEKIQLHLEIATVLGLSIDEFRNLIVTINEDNQVQLIYSLWDAYVGDIDHIEEQ